MWLCGLGVLMGIGVGVGSGRGSLMRLGRFFSVVMEGMKK